MVHPVLPARRNREELLSALLHAAVWHPFGCRQNWAGCYAVPHRERTVTRSHNQSRRSAPGAGSCSVGHRGGWIDVVGALGPAVALLSGGKLPSRSQLGLWTPDSGVRLTLTRYWE